MRRILSVVLTAGLLSAAFALPAVASVAGTSERGIVPLLRAGNFVASDDQQVCYELARQGFVGEVDTDMRGFKIDPPRSYDDGYVKVTLSADGRSLEWQATNATVHAFIVKGGPNYHVYNYTGTGFDWDKGLVSPLQNRKLPAISHYNVCYTPDPPEGDQGCTPGYWRNHADRWLGAAPGDSFNGTFGVNLYPGNPTLGMVISAPQTYGTFGFHAVAALLNSYGGVPNADGTTVAYPYTTAEVLQLVQDAVANGTTAAAKDLLAGANELGCPLSGTRATRV